MARKGSFIDTLGKLFASPQVKERERVDRQRRIQYLKRKYSPEPHIHVNRKSGGD